MTRRGGGRSVGDSAPKPAWGRRIVLAGAAIVAASYFVTASFAQVARKADPIRASRLAPGNGIIGGAAALTVFQGEMDPRPGSSAGAMATRALLADPTAIDAIVVLGLQADLRGEARAADRYFRYALSLSRRKLQPQVWSIEKAVQRGDLRSALYNYDLALRTSAEAKTTLFPTLAAALAEPRIRAALLDIMRTKPAWGSDFVVFAANSGVDPASALRFFQEGDRAALALTDDNRSGLVNAFARANDFDSAWRYYATYRPGDPRRSRDPDFRLRTDARAIFDWTPNNDPSASSSILASEKGGMVDFAVPPGIRTTIVSQLQALPAGNYRLSGHAQAVVFGRNNGPSWILSCRDGRVLGSVPLARNDASRQVFRGQFTVPQGCNFQTLALIAGPTDDIGGISGQILDARLEPLS